MKRFFEISCENTDINEKGNKMSKKDGNVAKSYVGEKPHHKNKDQKKLGSNIISKKIGMILTAVQGIASAIMVVVLFMLNMLPLKYLAVVIGMLAILLLITLVGQLKSRKKAMAGKVFSVCLSIVLAIGSFYIVKANSAMGKITGSNYKVDTIVVAVLADNPAEKLADAKAYQFGVQYAMGGDDVESTMKAIDKELGTTVSEVEYSDLHGQAQALHDGEVEAIVYNEAYAGLLEETFENYSSNVKIIYKHSIKKAVENTASEVSVKDDTFSVFISGIDVYGPIATNSRSDVNIIATVNPTTHQVLLINTPRDFYVEIPEITGGAKDKLTHAGIYGVDASMRTLGTLYDTNISFYSRVNFTSLVEIVNQLGGVDVESEYAFTTSYDSGLVMDVQQGTNHFNGEQALAFSRERQNIEGGDNQRGKNQQAVITGIIKKMISPSMLVNANGLMNSVSGNVETNMSTEQLQALVKDQLSSGAAWNIKSMAAAGTGDEQYCFSYAGAPLYVTQPNQVSIDAIKNAIDAVENGETLPDSQMAQ